MGRPIKVTQNKIIVIAKEVGGLTQDSDLTARKIAETLNMTEGRVSQIYKEHNRFSIKHLFKKLSTKDS